jgi:PAS domain S-box-containing protein
MKRDWAYTFLFPWIRNFRIKLAIFLAMPATLISLFIYFYFPAQLKRQAVRMAANHTRAAAVLMAFSIGPAVFLDDSQTIDEILKERVQNGSLEYAVACDTAGRVLGGAGFGQDGLQALRQPQSIDGVFTKRSDVVHLKHPLTLHGRKLGNLFVGVSIADLNRQVRQNRNAAALVSALAFLAALLFSIGLAGLITRPIADISRTANTIAEGDMTQRAPVHSQDELGQLAKSFNAMVSRLHSAYDELEALNRGLEQRVQERTRDLENENAERKRTEIALRETYSQLQTLIQSIPDVIHVKGVDGRIRICNKAFARLVGRKPAEILGRTDSELMPKEAAEFCRKTDEETLTKRKATRHADRSYVKDGKTLYFETIKAPLFDESGTVTGLVAVSRDITEQRNKDEEKRKIEAQLVQAQKMEAVGILAGGIAHDFNNLLTAIIGSAEMALRNRTESDPLTKDLHEILAAGERAAELTRQLLYFSRKQHMRYVTFSLNSLIDNLFGVFHRIIGEDIQLFTELAPDLWSIRGDKGTVEQVVMNLIVNARDAMPKGGRVTLKTENVTIGETDRPWLTDPKPGQYVRLSVSDTGCGMNKETQDHIFEPFFTTKEVGKGTGLGLSVVYGILKQHGGWVNVYSEPNMGSTFKIYIPAVIVSEPSDDDSTEEAQPLEGIKGKGERILLIEDEKRLSEFIKRALCENGYAVIEAMDGAEAMRVFEAEGHRFDLVLSDVVLPGIGGLDLMDALLEKKPDLKVLLSSGYTDHKSQWPIIEEKGYRFLQKPYNLIELLKAIRETLIPDTGGTRDAGKHSRIRS